MKSDSSWGHTGGIGKDPKAKKLPRTWSKKRTNTDPKTYMKIMSGRGR